MAIHYPMQTFGRFRLGMGITYALIREKFGFELGERYHLDLEHRIKTNMQIDRAVLSQARYLHEHYGDCCKRAEEFDPHYRLMSSLPNLGSVINTAFSVQGDQLYADYALNPRLVSKFYGSITELMLRCLAYFPRVDGWPLTDVFIGNCCVSMISPAQYEAINLPQDRRLMEYARGIGARFMMHQDSDANHHLESYAKLDYLHALDIGQDTDFENVFRLFPDVSVNCILFPAWLQAHCTEDVREELLRLMKQGKAFPSFSFTVLEIDSEFGNDRIFPFYEVFRQCVESAGDS